MLARRLFTVEDRFAIEGRGLVLVPGIIPYPDERFGAGDPILLKRPNGSLIEWHIGGLEIIYGGPPRNDFSIMLRDLDKDDVPIGTEVWSVVGTSVASDRHV